MWRNIPLNIKLVACLILVQATSLALGVLWLGTWVEKARLHELTRRLDTQGDTLEGFIRKEGEELAFDGENETVHELDDDRNFYFCILDPRDRVIARSASLDKGVLAELGGKFAEINKHEQFHTVSLSSGHWIIHQEVLRGPGTPPETIGVVQIGLNVEPTLNDIARFRRYIALGAFGVLLVTSLGSGLVVSLSTRNIREFARAIRKIVPPRFAGEIRLSPQSAEEKLLFDSYGEVLKGARASSESQRLFIAHASHELKTPIAAAMAALEVTLNQPRTAAEYAETCRDVLAEIKTLRRLSTTLLSLARMDSVADAPPGGISDLSSLLQGVVGRWEKIALLRQITIHTASIDDVALVRGSSDQWQVVLNNLVDNSIKYGKLGGRVAINVRTADSTHLEIVVADDGIGMAEEELTRLGQAFFRADAARSSNESFGLGFAHAKRVVDEVGGTIKVTSRKGTGTTVKVTVPRLSGAHPPKENFA